MKPRLLDLFCGAGGAARGYQRAGFYVVGVDIVPQPNFGGDEFHQADALTVPLDGFDVIHASPPCQPFSRAGKLREAQGGVLSSLDLLDATRERLIASGLPWVIENVEGAPLYDPLLLCGSMFGLEVRGRQLRRHRLFESPDSLSPPGPCQHRGKPLGVYHRPNDRIPHGGETVASLAEGRELMGIDWMVWHQLKEAIPPAYTTWIGTQLLRAVEAVA